MSDPSMPIASGVAVIGADVHTAVLVEGASDERAVHTLASRLERDLRAEGIAVVPMGGATNIRRFLERLGPNGADLKLAGLCDAREAVDFRRGLVAAGLAPTPNPDIESLGFFVCEADLEDELIRALGVTAVEQVIDRERELASLRILQRQPAQRDRSPEQQLHRFLGSRAGRKLRYAELLVASLDLSHLPPPLEGLLGYI